MATAHPTATPDRARAALGLAIAAALATIGLTAVAFWLSYEALHDLATDHHLSGPRAWAWPATLDSFIVVGELLVLRASLLRRVDWFAIGLVALGSAGSIVLNVVSVGKVDPITQVVAAIPPTAALLAFTALMRQIFRALAAPAPAPGPKPRWWSRRKPAASQLDPATTELTQASAPAIPPMPARKPIAYRDDRAAVVRPLYDSGYRPGTAEMRAALQAAGHGQLTGGTIRGRIRAEVEEHEPELADYPERQFAIAG
ncbi:DUF2637 domain-containing protein [Kitasatospora sp. NPDC004289]